MGCGASVPKEPPHPAVDQPWACKDEATRVFHLVRASARTPHCTLAIDTHLFFRPQADLDGNGCLDADELKAALRNKQFVDTAMQNLDTNLDGKVSLREWLIAMKETFDKSEVASRGGGPSDLAPRLPVLGGGVGVRLGGFFYSEYRYCSYG